MSGWGRAKAIDTVTVGDPRDCSYPFAEALYDDPTVVYHGTSSRNVAAIEVEGLAAGVPRFPVRAIQELVDICDAVAFRSWSYTTVKGLSRGTNLELPDGRCVYLSANFFYARDYATNVGGETVHNALLLADQLLQYLRDKPERTAFQSQLAAIQGELTNRTGGGFPVVYAVRVRPEWLEGGDAALRRRDLGSLVVSEVNISCRVSIPVACLCAKVEYPAGAETGCPGPQPKTWAVAREWGGGPTRR